MRKLRTIEMNRLSVEEFKEADKLPLVVVLDDVRSMYNIGSVFRTADAFRVKAIYLCGITATPPHPEIHKTALGGEDSVAWRYFPSALEAVEELRRSGHYVFAVEQCEGSTKLQELFGGEKYRGERREESGERDVLGTGEQEIGVGANYAVVLGNEVKGVHQEVVDACDDCLEIPQFGTKHSMNVSVTAGIVMWEFFKKLASPVLQRYMPPCAE